MNTVSQSEQLADEKSKNSVDDNEAEVLHLIYEALGDEYRLVNNINWNDMRYLISRTENWFDRLILRWRNLIYVSVVVSILICVFWAISAVLLTSTVLYTNSYLEWYRNWDAGLYFVYTGIPSICLLLLYYSFLDKWMDKGLKWRNSDHYKLLGDLFKNEIKELRVSLSTDFRIPAYSYHHTKKSGYVEIRLFSGKEIILYFEGVKR